MRIPRNAENLLHHFGHLTKADLALIGGIIVLSVLVLLSAKIVRPKGSVVEISVGGVVSVKQELNRDSIINVQGPIGTTVVKISNRQVRILSSPCRDKLCMHMGAIDARGGVLVCVPNEVSVRIVSDENELFDALTR